MSFVVTNAIFDLLASASPSPNPLPAAPEASTNWVQSLPPGIGGIIAVFTAVFTLLAGILTFLGTQTEGLNKLLENLQKLLKGFRQDATAQTTDARRKLLRELKREVTLRRKRLLHNLIMIDLLMQEQPRQVGEPDELELAPDWETDVERVLKVGDTEERLQAVRNLTEIFRREDVDGKLLILGEPGSGKTTELLRFARELIGQAQTDDKAPIPVIFELSAWKDDKQKIGDWLAAQLKEKYNLPLAVSRQWLKDATLLPLLDGLDELGMTRQISCIKAINEFLSGTVRYPQLVVCCRREEYEQGYEQGNVRLDELNAAIYLKALSDAQIQKYLQDLNRPRLWQAIQQEAGLSQLWQTQPDGKPGLLRSPLFLSILVTAYQGQPIRNQQELFDAYIDRRFNLHLPKQAYEPGKEPSRKQTRHYLSVLAHRLKAESKTEFLIEKMQPYWLETNRQKWLYRLIFGLIVGLIGGLIGGLIFGLIYGLIVGLIYGLIFRLISLRAEIKPVEAFQISMSRYALRKFFWGLGQWLIVGLIVGLFGGPIYGLFGGLIYGLIVGLIGGLIGGLILRLKADIKIRSKPNQGMWNSAKNTVMTTIVFVFLYGLGYGLLDRLLRSVLTSDHTISALTEFLAFLLWLGICGGGGLALFQHFALRLVLWQNKLIPWNYAKFLDYASDLRVIQRIGGRYRFVHDLLREHFAAMEE